MNRASLAPLERATIERYSARLGKFGDDPRTLGWDTRRNQLRRFEAALRLADPAGKKVLDIGCGFADFLGFLKDRGAVPRSYRGLDINRDLLKVARRKHPGASFEARNLLTRPFSAPACDVGYMFGLLNFRLKTPPNKAFAAALIKAAFAACREALVVDMLSAERDPAYPKESAVCYYEPAWALGMAFGLTPHATLKHDYASLPQREFMLCLRRRPEGLR